MRNIYIRNIIENVSHREDLYAQHGLSFYVETKHHKMLIDTGASAKFLKNAETLGIDLTQVDTVILSHGHYDHGGGLPAFLEINHTAKVYMQESAFGEYYALDDNREEYIGINKALKGHPQIVLLNGDFKIDEELFLFSGITQRKLWASSNTHLQILQDGSYVQDTFNHEQNLVITANGKTVLFGGCAHNGIVNILDRYTELFNKTPDVVIGGFHLMAPGASDGGPDKKLVEDTADNLMQRKIQYYTCHCTGLEAYDILKKKMNEQIAYFSTGDILEV